MHVNILSEEQIALLAFLKQFKKDYYLVGGTAIALQIGHRQSIDFDLFKLKTINKTKIKSLIDAQGLQFQLMHTDAESFHCLLNDVKFTFFQYPFVVPISHKSDFCKMPNLLHLAAMKAYALGRRAKWKDYVDLYFILRDYHTLDEISLAAKSIFEEMFSPKMFRQQLCYFQDIDYTEEVFYSKGFAVAEEDVKAFLINTAIS
jgi:hypothetical protein